MRSLVCSCLVSSVTVNAKAVFADVLLFTRTRSETRVGLDQKKP